MRNKGPLLNIALALFGNQSFLAERSSHPEAYTATSDTDSTCVDTLPLGKLAGLPCIDGTQNASSQIESWLSLFTDAHEYEDYFMPVLLNQAAFLSNEILLTSKNSTSAWGPQSYLTVHYDHGVDTIVPVISNAGIIVTSIFLAFQLLALSILAVYGCWTGLWTDSLDSFTMLRLGAAVGGSRLPLWLAKDIDKLPILDQTPGWVGDNSGSDNVGQLAIGAEAKVKPRVTYRCFDESNLKQRPSQLVA